MNRPYGDEGRETRVRDLEDAAPYGDERSGVAERAIGGRFVNRPYCAQNDKEAGMEK